MIKRFGSTEAGYFCGCMDYKYTVEMDKKMTLEEFCQNVIVCEPKEWGYIGVHKIGAIFGEPKIEYRDGELLSKFNESYAKKFVESAFCVGSWSRMDYEVYLEEQKK